MRYVTFLMFEYFATVSTGKRSRLVDSNTLRGSSFAKTKMWGNAAGQISTSATRLKLCSFLTLSLEQPRFLIALEPEFRRPALPATDFDPQIGHCAKDSITTRYPPQGHGSPTLRTEKLDFELSLQLRTPVPQSPWPTRTARYVDMSDDDLGDHRGSFGDR